jgi:hypothetical protein
VKGEKSALQMEILNEVWCCRCRRVVVIVVVIAHVSSGNFWQLRGHDDEDLLRMELLKLRAESCKRGQTKRWLQTQ